MNNILYIPEEMHSDEKTDADHFVKAHRGIEAEETLAEFRSVNPNLDIHAESDFLIELPCR